MVGQESTSHHLRRNGRRESSCFPIRPVLRRPAEVCQLWRRCFRFWVDRQTDDERSASPGLALNFNVSTVLLNNLMDDDQTESRTLMLITLVFGGEKGIKDVF